MMRKIWQAAQIYFGLAEHDYMGLEILQIMQLQFSFNILHTLKKKPYLSKATNLSQWLNHTSLYSSAMMRKIWKRWERDLLRGKSKREAVAMRVYGCICVLCAIDWASVPQQAWDPCVMLLIATPVGSRASVCVRQWERVGCGDGGQTGKARERIAEAGRRNYI